ncbi:MAG: ATP-dependent Clp protease proteolytic subunit [Clostridia bacterium]|nr:ATP-dependent Clp protease proteolytic subunit [Clostridia bacterium]
MKKIIRIIGEINEATLNNVIDVILESLHSSIISDIVILIHSTCENKDVAASIVDFLTLYPGNIITINIGACGVCAASIFCCGNQRYMTANSCFKVSADNLKSLSIGRFRDYQETFSCYSSYYGTNIFTYRFSSDLKFVDQVVDSLDLLTT